MSCSFKEGTNKQKSDWRIDFFHVLYSTLLHLRDSATSHPHSATSHPHSARSHPIPAIDLFHSRLDLIHTRLDLTVYELYTYFRHFSYIFARTLELLLPCCFWYPCDCWRLLAFLYCWHPCSCRFPCCLQIFLLLPIHSCCLCPYIQSECFPSCRWCPK
jgi:hypothetical protein